MQYSKRFISGAVDVFVTYFSNEIHKYLKNYYLDFNFLFSEEPDATNKIVLQKFAMQ